MVKIKTKKQLNLPQLIDWLLKSGHRNYTANSDMENTVILSGYGAIQFSPGTFFPEETFTVEVETEITENTVIPKIVSIGRKKENEINIYHYCRISQFIDNKDFNYYVLNDDDTLTLIWCDGKLIKE